MRNEGTVKRAAEVNFPVTCCTHIVFQGIVLFCLVLIGFRVKYFILESTKERLVQFMSIRS